VEQKDFPCGRSSCTGTC